MKIIFCGIINKINLIHEIKVNSFYPERRLSVYTMIFAYLGIKEGRGVYIPYFVSKSIIKGSALSTKDL